MNAWNNARLVVPLPVRRHRVGHVQRATTTATWSIFRNASNGSAIATTYSWWNSSQSAAGQRHHRLGRRVHVLYRHVGLRRDFELRLPRRHRHARVRPRAGTEPFDHTDATMYPSYSYCSQELRTLASDDVNGVQALYPGGAANTAPTVTHQQPGQRRDLPVGNVDLARRVGIRRPGRHPDVADPVDRQRHRHRQRRTVSRRADRGGAHVLWRG